jgi:microcystin-dependent protein
MTTFRVIRNNDFIDCIGQRLDFNRFLGIRIGDYRYTACSTDVNNWLVCDGRSLLRSKYPDLFDVLGTSFGSNDGDTFNLPDFRGRVPGQVGPGPDLTTRNLGDSIGSETNTLTVNQLPPHLHTGTTDASGIHTHGITDPGHTHSYVNQPFTTTPAVSLTTEDVAANTPANETTGSSTTGITVNNAGSHVHTFTSNNTGGGQTVNNIQPTLFGGNVLILSRVDMYNNLPELAIKFITSFI